MTPPAPQIPTDPYSGWRLWAEMIYPGSAGGEGLPVWNPPPRKTSTRAAGLAAIIALSYVPYYGFGLLGWTLLQMAAPAMSMAISVLAAMLLGYWLFTDWRERLVSGQLQELWLTGLEGRTLLAGLLTSVVRPLFWFMISWPLAMRAIHALLSDEVGPSAKIRLVIFAAVLAAVCLWRAWICRGCPWTLAIIILAAALLVHCCFMPRDLWELLPSLVQYYFEFYAIGFPASVLALLICSRLIMEGRSCEVVLLAAGTADLIFSSLANIAGAIMLPIYGLCGLCSSSDFHYPEIIGLVLMFVLAIYVAHAGIWRLPRSVLLRTRETPHLLRTLIILALLLGPVCFLSEWALFVSSWLNNQYLARLMLLPANAAVAILLIRACVAQFARLADTIRERAPGEDGCNTIERGCDGLGGSGRIG